MPTTGCPIPPGASCSGGSRALTTSAISSCRSTPSTRMAPDLVPLLDCEVGRPRFSPDGSRLAFGIAMDDGTLQIATMAADGSDLTILTSTDGYADTPD